ncbi:MAG: OmpA family protein [Ignavibacteria bacterium]
MKRNLLVLFALLALFSIKANAQFKNYGIKGGVQYQQLLPFSEYSAAYSFLGRAFINFELTNNISIDIGAGYGQYKTNDDIHTRSPVGTSTTTDNFVKTEIIPVDLRLKLTPWARTAINWNPYFYVGTGVLHYKVKEVPDINIPEYKSFPDSYTGFGSLGFGTEVKMGKNVLLDFSAGASYFFTDRLNNFVSESLEDAEGHIAVGISFAGNDDGNLDPDGDGLINMREEQIGTDPLNPDSDGDGLKDGAEVDQYKTNPLNRDTDGDKLTDGEEVLTYSTNPLNMDSDADKLNDYDEVKVYNTLPNDSDTDNDNLSDGEEVLTYKTDPKVVDTDLGSIGDGVEVGRGTNPLNPADDLPVVVAPPISVGTVIILEGINFASGSAEISSGSEAPLESALKTMRDNPNIDVEISGHTDNRGGRSYNENLSLNRAESVKSWLVSNGVSASRIETRGYAYDQPIATNDTEEGRLKNRRIEFKVIR